MAAAIERTHHTVRDVSEHVRIPFPGVDIPADKGVCTDGGNGSYRAVGVDRQKEFHEYMLANFVAYPDQRRWLLRHLDSNIDHGRGPNLMVFFQRKGESLPITSRGENYSPGDLVTWDLGGGVPHIGIVVHQKSGPSGRYMIVHNIAEGPKNEGCAVQLEDYRPPPVFWTIGVEALMTLAGRRHDEARAPSG